MSLYRVTDDCALYCSIIYRLVLAFISYKEVFTGYTDNCSVEHAELQLEISQRLNYLE